MHQIALQLGPLTIHWYGVLVATGFLAALWTASRRSLRDHIVPDTIMDLGPWLIIGALVGARAWFVVSYWQESFANKPFTEIFMVQKGGLVFYGGLIGASLACILFARQRKLPLWKIADITAPSIALGHMFGRIGCLMNGCCYGRACGYAWGIRFPGGHETQGVAVHPTQIYESLLNLGLYGALAWLYRRKKFDGQVFASYLVGYAFLRSFVEQFRGDYPVRHITGGLTPGQMVSVGILVVAALLFWRLPRKTTGPASSPPASKP